MRRQSHYDNIKFFLILLVVVGHFADRCATQSYSFRALYSFIYLFHMPAFLFISGLFSKKYVNQSSFPCRKIGEFVLLYFITKLLFSFMWLIYYNKPRFYLFVEPDLPWYFLALLYSYIVTWCIKKYPFSRSLMLSLIIGCFIGYDNNIGDFFALSRCITFFPFFLLGYYLNPERLSICVSKKRFRIPSVLLLLAAVQFCYKYGDFLYAQRSFLKANIPYTQIPFLAYHGGAVRFAYYIVCILLIFSVISVIPRNNQFYSKYGTHTLPIMVLHIPIKEFVFRFGIYSWLVTAFPAPYWKIAYISLAIIITFILGTRLCNNFFRRCLYIS